MLRLAITTSTSVVGVAVARGNQLLAEASIETDRRHAEELTPMLQAVLAKAGVALSDLEQLAVDVGPGRFTGLRVGMATTRTLALALGIEVVGITSLELLAIGANTDEPLLAVIDARRSEVFEQAFVGGSPSTEARVIAADLLDAAANKYLAVGDGADRYSDCYPNRVEGQSPSAAVLVVAADGRPSLPGPKVMPLYMREPDVQVNIKTRHNT